MVRVRARGGFASKMAGPAMRKHLRARKSRKRLSYPALTTQPASKTPAKSTKLPAVLGKPPAEMPKLPAVLTKLSR
jgi:hypothetical protein